jgi:hypothetical protein
LALGVTGTVIGLALLTCGGLAGYVAWTGSSGEPRNVLVAPKERRSEIQTISDEMVLIVEDLIKLLDHASTTYRRDKQPDAKEAKRIAAVLRAVADDIEP